MSIRHAEAKWEGKLRSGQGMLKLESGAYEGGYTYEARFEEAPGTNPEELIGAALAGCFSMAFSLELEKAGHSPHSIETQAAVHFEKVNGGFGITKIVLSTKGRVSGIDEKTFKEIAEAAKNGCPVSRALNATEIELASAELVS